MAADPSSLNARIMLADFYTFENRLRTLNRPTRKRWGFIPRTFVPTVRLPVSTSGSIYWGQAAADPQGVAENARLAEDVYVLTDFYVVTGQKKRL